ncbi:MAG: hypothetical protein KAH86_07985, partial [Methanosarcinales archaeon]|nr:hypothetical protein [Methanosarcinales archaeon]
SKKTYDVSSSIVSATSNLLNKINKLTGNQIQYSDATSIENDISTINTNIGIVTNEIDNVRNTMKSTVGMLQQLQSIGGKLPGVSSLSSSILDAESSLATASSNLKTQSSSLNSIASNANLKSSTETQKSFSRLDSTVDVKINNADNAKSGINNLMANLRDSGINVQIAPETSSVLSGMEEPLRSAKSFKGNDYYASIIDAKKASVEGEKAAKSAYENTINHVKSYTSDVENSAYLGNVDISDASNQIKKAESQYEQIKYVDAVISLDSAVTSLDDSLKGATLKNNLMVGIGAIIAMLIIFVVIKTQRKKKKMISEEI